jgi:tetratricopeptide (TPR) repeat protein
MALKAFFSDQLEQIRSFMTSLRQTVRVVQLESDVEPLLKKLLVGLDEDDNCPHVMVFATTPFSNPAQYFSDALVELAGQNEQHRDAMAAKGVQVPRLADYASLPPTERFNQYLSDLADRLAEWVDSYVVVIQPKSIDDPAGFKFGIEYLTNSTRSKQLKYLVLDHRKDPLLPDLAEKSERAGVQVFHLSPAEIEAQIKADLASGQLTPQEKRQYTAMTAAFAFSNRKYDDAELIQRDVLKMAEQNGTPAEQANACYALGNTFLKQGKLELAEGSFARAVMICVEGKINALLAMALTNLGVTLQRQNRLEESVQSFDTARRTFHALNYRPGEAFVLDNKAATLAAAKLNADAERAWLEALRIFDGITAPSFAKLRETSRDDILDKLRHFYEATGQRNKIQALPA